MVKELPSRNSFGNVADTFGVHYDFQAVISIAKNKSFNGKNKRIRLRHEVVKQLLKYGIISIDYVKSKVNLANPLTKHLGRKLILETSSGIVLKPIIDWQ